MSDLRDHIKEEVLDGILSMFSENDSVEMAAGYIADAVIRELGLREERGWDAVQRFGDRSPFRIINRLRYVTQWRTTYD
jgi:hypothetical protein